LKILAESGPVPGFDDKKRKLDSEDLAARKKISISAWTGKPHDMEKLAAAIEKLEETDLLPVVKMILENQTAEMYVKSDVERTNPLSLSLLSFFGVLANMGVIEGEFHFDLYTLGNNVLSQLWDYTKSRVNI
jgi:transcription initiation factor IIF auxiliary subunit